MKLDQIEDESNTAPLRGYVLRHYEAVEDRKLCQSKEYYRVDQLEEATNDMAGYLEPECADFDSPGVYVVELLEHYGADDEGFDLLGDSISKIKYRIEKVSKVTLL